jgi:hypothetical protein
VTELSAFHNWLISEANTSSPFTLVKVTLVGGVIIDIAFVASLNTKARKSSSELTGLNG